MLTRLLLLLLLFAYDSTQVLQQSAILPSTPSANSQVFLRKSDPGNYSIVAGDRSSCRFKTAVVPCECLLEVSDNYTLLEDDKIIANFSVSAPVVDLQLPSNHEILQELNVFVVPKLCLPELYTLRLEFRSFEVLPNGEETPWRTVGDVAVTLHNKRVSAQLACHLLADSGYYRVQAISSRKHVIVSKQWIVVSRTSETSLRLRNDSIFPHCQNEFDLSWTIAKCSAPSLQYRIRVLALPEGNDNYDDRALYIEEVGVTAEQTQLSISCGQFDILYEKYCFELVSVNVLTSVFHLWHKSCVSTEPVRRENGGWSKWSDWTPCSASCGKGKSKRVRYCDNPPPNRGKECQGDVIEVKDCEVVTCPEKSSLETVTTVSNCTCGCRLTEPAGSFYATAANSQLCNGNMTWFLLPAPKTTVVDFVVKRSPDTFGKLFFFRHAPYEELVWFAGSNQEPAFTLQVDQPIYVVLWTKDFNQSQNAHGYTILYTIREPAVMLPVRNSQTCHPFCPETIIISSLGIIFMLIIFIPPFVCANVTQRLVKRRHSSPHTPLLDHKCMNEMQRSANTDTTHVSGSSRNNYVTKRSIGIQLSVQSTPKVPRSNCVDSPLPLRGGSSMSACDELEYDYYDGIVPGSFLLPVDAEMLSQIDIDQIIAESTLFNDVAKHDVHTQI